MSALSFVLTRIATGFQVAFEDLRRTSWFISQQTGLSTLMGGSNRIAVTRVGAAAEALHSRETN